jgi:pyruvate dehydrogenase E2 component (dihydrolipoamide acetyltransferase)
MSIAFKLPELGEHVESADLIKIMVSLGDRIAVDQPVLELETEKADFELPSSVDGIIKEIHVREGDKVKIGQLIFTLEESTAVSAPPSAVTAAAAEPEPGHPAAEMSLKAERPGERGGDASAGPGEVAVTRPLAPATPTVRRLARELGIAIERVPGSGPAGRILTEDVKAFAKKVIAATDEAHAPVVREAQPLPDFSRWGEVERSEMTGIRRKTAESMSHAWSSIPHVTQYENADITELEQLRKRFAAEIETSGGKLTITSIAVKVIASALKVFPSFAASLDMDRQQIIFKKYCHIGVAVDTERGLIVPVIRDADKKNILELSIELARLAEKARNKKVTLEELQGGVFTITNLGGIGGTQFAPIIHAPEVAILGISRARHEAVLVEGKFEPRLILPLALSYDHRLIDGAAAARFMRWVAKALEQPFLLPLEG